jgi:asparagine synthase (glutamine-hydrolysing)
MCGIFGSVGDPVDAGVIKNVLATLNHRGPDANGTAYMKGATFAHTRLSIVDLSSAAAQPMSNDDNSICVTFNGEIFNFKDVRSELESHGHRFHSASDTEVILRGYEQWGEDVVSRLDGMFAFGIWDARVQTLLLARDRAGKKPLFYTQHDGRFEFSSEIKGLFAAGMSLEVNPRGVVGYLAYGYCPPPETLYKNIVQLPPAHLLVLQHNAAPVVKRYWSLDFQARIAPASEEEACERVAELLGSAVRKRMVADVPVGAFLSGGLDSTIVVALMAQTGQRVRTFSIGSPEPRYDETRFARMASEAFGTDHTELQVTPADFSLVEKLVWLHDGPFGDSSAIPSYIVSQLTRKQVTVALTGDGGDELFAGYLRFIGATISERIPTPIRPVLGALAGLLPAGTQSRGLLARARRLMTAANLPLADRLTAWTSYFAFGHEGLLRPELRTFGQDVLNFHRSFFHPPAHRTALALALHHNFETYLPHDLLVKTDRTTMAHGLEARSPFLDTALMEYVSGLPDNYKLRGRTTKYILRKAFAHKVPPEILTRGKMGFGIPLATWFRNDLRTYLTDHIASPTSGIGQYVELPYVKQMLAEHESGAADHEHQLWALLTMEIWLRSLPTLAKPWGATDLD